MAVKIRLARRGRKKQAMYDVVIADARAPRDGRFIEKIGTYNPNTDPAFINIDNDRAFKWLMDGAQPTDTVKAMLSYRGLMLKKHLQIGVIKGALTQEEADKKFEAWLADKDAKIQTKADQIAQSKADAKKAKLEAEAKVNAARAEALAAKKAEADAAAQPAEEEATEEAAADAEATEEVTAEAETSEEAPAEEGEAKE
ncbi:30S ribosomal protein S16 [Roseivirga sp.]|uniref:30S ribosomal protein S16 n=1 Tax=Roseivirga sp. TaxID=1964215 RepID=UPI003B520764